LEQRRIREEVAASIGRVQREHDEPGFTDCGTKHQEETGHLERWPKGCDRVRWKRVHHDGMDV
jgi:hypothetical protein